MRYMPGSFVSPTLWCLTLIACKFERDKGYAMPFIVLFAKHPLLDKYNNI
jgi:hypothetical protein